jgi:hypothetical protein
MNHEAHPSQELLALLAGGDATLGDRLGWAWHTRRCLRCRTQLAALRADIRDLRLISDEMPADLDWPALASEMKANIRLGLSAGALVGDIEDEIAAPAEPIRWRAAVVLASLAVVVGAGLLLHQPVPAPPPVAVFQPSPAILLEANPSGIEVQQHGSAMTLLAPGSGTAVTNADWGGSLRTRFVDADSGQVTIQNVYAE